jgi:NADPH-dependent glutamate synthase beta subunit-like oxidoreductase
MSAARKSQGPSTHRPKEVTGPPTARTTAEVPTIWTTGWTEVFNTGTWRAATPVHEWRPSPCHADCPIGNAIPRWIKPIGDGSHREAWDALVETNPFPAVTGRVCHHPCEVHCNREVLEQVVGINGLEHFLGDRALEEGWPLPAAGDDQGKRVAVVGGGPAGLSCAYHLRRLGYAVTVFEASPELGGLLRNGIPEYRLSSSVLDREIQRILDLGVEVVLGVPVAGPTALETLRAEFDAVFVAVGAQRSKSLPQVASGSAAARVFDGLEYLRRCTEGVARELGERMVVVGGGSAAIDVARSARRLGHQVAMVALETRETMPAQPEEVQQALDEGVVLFDGAMVEAADTTTADGALSLSCRKVVLDPLSPPGEFRPRVIEGGDFTLSADVIVTAIGQEPDLQVFEDACVIEGGVLAIDVHSRSTSVPGVFAGGDAASLNRYVSEAIGDGRRAAYGIAAYLGHPTATQVVRPALEEAVNRKEVNPFYFEFAARTERAEASVEERLRSFEETLCGYSEEEASVEARRCMSCGLCVRCDNCFVFCPDMAVKKDAEAPEGAVVVTAAPGAPADSGPFYFVLDQYCKGCGLCVTECPRGAVRLEQVAR